MKFHLLRTIFGVVLCGIADPSLAATVNVASFGDGSAARANAQAAINTASPGDTIVFPLNGSATWTSSLTIDKALTIDGNGTTLSTGATLNNGFFHITGFTSNALMRVTGFTFNLVNFTPSGKAINVVNVSLDNLRIDHNTFHFGYEQIGVGGSKGVIDHNFFYNPLKAISFTAGSIAQANQSWESMAAGTGDALFVEDNSFIYNGSYPGTFSQESIGTYNGGKLVIRYNNWDSTSYPLSLTIDPIMTHGSAAGGVANGYWQIGTMARRGQSVVEIYNNEMVGKRIDFMAILRGSANLVYSNVLTLTGAAPLPRIYMREEEYGGGQWSPARTAWPAEDQVHNTFIWANTFNGVAQTSANIITGDIVGAIVESRDYFLHEPQATGGRAIFTGANGASGSFPTNGTTYPTLGTMVFEPTGPNAYYGYTPYTYPHPLTLPAQASTTANAHVFTP